MRWRSIQIFIDIVFIVLNFAFSVVLIVVREECMDQFDWFNYYAISWIALIIANLAKTSFIVTK